MKTTIALAALICIIFNVNATPTLKETIAEIMRFTLTQNQATKEALQLGNVTGTLSTATGISAGILTWQTLLIAPFFSDTAIGRVCALSASVVVGIHVRKETAPLYLQHIITHASIPSEDIGDSETEY